MDAVITAGIEEALASEVRAEAARQRLAGTAIAEHLGYTKQTISQKLNGKTAITVEDLFAIAKLLHVPAAEIFRRAEESLTTTELTRGGDAA
nr:MAG TPA: helix-turn-helix domain protein [Caudoviricetes sp.]